MSRFRPEHAALSIVQVGAVICVLVGLPYETFDLDRHSVPKELVLHLAAATAGLLLLVKARRLALSLADALLLAFLALGVLSALAATNHWLALRALGISLSGAGLFWVARALVRSGFEQQLRLALAFAVVLAALTALLQAYGLETNIFSVKRAPGGTFGNRNFMAHFLAIGLPVLLLSSLQTRRGGRIWLLTAGVGAVSAALVLSRSRGAWLSVAVVLFFMGIETLVVNPHPKEPLLRRRSSRLGVAALLGVVVALVLPNRLDWRSESPYLDSLRDVTNYREGSGRGRLIQYANSLRMAKAHPILGVGPGNWAVEYPSFTAPGDPSYDPNDYIPTNPWPSSDWVGLAAERGLPALAILLLIGAGIALNGWRRWREGVQEDDYLPGLTSAALLISVAVAGCFDAVLLLPAPTFLVWSAAGALAPPTPPRRTWTVSLSGRRRLATLLGIGVVALTLVFRSGSQVAAMAQYDSARDLAQQERAARTDPANYRIHVLLARSYLRRDRCDRALLHARSASALFPRHPAARALTRACNLRVRSD